MKSGLIRMAAAACFAAAGVFAPSVASAAEGGVPLDTFPTEKLSNLPALQNGARLFVNYCMGCHSAEFMRYNRLTDIGLTEEQIKENLIFGDSRVGDTMTIAMSREDAKEWVGAVPPDLSVTARSRSSKAGSGSDWIYTFLRSYYRDENRPTGWNNALYTNTGMPHVLWTLQGQRGVDVTDVKAEGGDHGGAVEAVQIRYDATGARTEAPLENVAAHTHAGRTYEFLPPVGGSMNRLEYDNAVGDLVAYMTFMADPTARLRSQLGVWVLVFLGVFFVAAWMLNKAFWRDIR